MKKLLFTISIFTILLITGCRENSINDATSNESSNKIQSLESTVTGGSFPLDGVLLFPGSAKSYYSIEGDISYTHTLVLVDPIPPAPQYYVSLDLSINAVLTDLNGTNSWIISEVTHDICYVSEEGIYLLEKSFSIQENTNGLTLVCRFLVTTDGVGLNAMWLSFGSDIHTNKNAPGDTITYPPVTLNMVNEL